MPYHDNPVSWAGVVLRMADGTTHAWEFAHGLDQAEFTVEQEGGDAFGRWWMPFGEETIDVHLRARRATYWREGAEHAKPAEPTKAIGEAPKEIEP